MKKWIKFFSILSCGFVFLFFCFLSYYEYQDFHQVPNSLANYNELYGFEEFECAPLMVLSNSKSGTTNLKNIVVFIEFSDSATLTNHHLDDPESVSNAEKIYNSETFSMNTVNGVLSVPSFKSYFKRQSYGKLLVDTEIYPKKNGNVVSYQSTHPMGYYQKYNASNPIGYKNSSESLERETELINQAILAVQSQIESSVSSSEIDAGNDGVVDYINFVVEGLSAVSSNISWGDLLWSHKLDNSNITSTILGKKVVSYNLLYAYDYTETAGLFSLDKGTYGTLIHEFGHTLGFSDLYRHGASSGERPVGFFDVMGNVIGSNPQPFLTYFISEYNRETNWHQPLPVIQDSQTVTLVKPTYNDTNEKRAVKIKVDDGKDEYFILEYHEKMNTYTDYSVDESGVIVYRVNEKNKYLGNNGSGTNGAQDLIYVFRPNETALGAAKGDLSQATLTMKRSSLGKNITIGDTKFDKDTIYYSDGSNSGLVIQVTSQTNDSVTVKITYPKMNGTGTKSDPYLIDSAQSFLFFMNRDTKGKYYKLLNDIDFSSIADYPSISFSGYFDGNNKTIRNITTKGTGIFRDIGDFDVASIVENLKVENIHVNPSNGDYLGGLSSVVTNGIIRNVHMISGSVKNTLHSFNDMSSTGGLVGNISNTTTIVNCSSSLEVQSPKNVGGLVGINMNGTIQNSFSNGLVQGTSNVGGLIGLQSISDAVYHIPSNVYYDMKNQNLKAVGGQSPFHNSTTLPTASLGRGLVGISVPSEVLVKENEYVNYSITTNPNSSLPFLFESSNSAIAVYENGKIRGVKAGVANIKVKLKVGTSYLSFSTKVTVQAKPVVPVEITGITLNQTSATLYVGATFQFHATVLPNNTTMSKTITWISNNTGVASIDKNGLVTARKAGTVVITATTSNGKKASATITVKAKPVVPVEITGITLNQTSATLQFHATVLPNNTTMSKVITWTSNNTGVASIDKNGLVTARKAGIVVITATTSNGKRASATITVKDKPVNITEAEVLKSFGLTKKDQYVSGFQLGAKVEDVIKLLSSKPSVTLVKFQNASNQTIFTGIISTNMKFVLRFNQKEYFYTVVIKGDVNGDGKIYATDYVKIKNHIMGKSKLSGAYYMAADINQDNQIYATDYMRIKNHIMGKSFISQT